MQAFQEVCTVESYGVLQDQQEIHVCLFSHFCAIK